jgi:hypothetical protein
MPIMMAWMVARGSGAVAVSVVGVASFIGSHHDGRRGKYNRLAYFFAPFGHFSGQLTM